MILDKKEYSKNFIFYNNHIFKSFGVKTNTMYVFFSCVQTRVIIKKTELFSLCVSYMYIKVSH